MTATLFTYDELVAQLTARNVPKDLAERAAADDIARRSAYERIADDFDRERKSESKTLVHVGTDRFAICRATVQRERDVLTARFELPPRTKKNHGRFFGIRQSAAYVRFRDAIIQAVAESKRELSLPLPDQPYNLEACFYVDKPGERADLFGLLQGFADALQDAGVVTDDWHFRTTDRTRIVFGDELPRVECTITPTEA